MVMATSTITTITEDYATINSLDRELFVGHSQVRDGLQDGKLLIHDTLKRRIEEIDTDGCRPGEEDAFFVADMGEVYRQHLRWKLNLKRVKPHYGQSSLCVIPRKTMSLMSCSREMQPRHGSASATCSIRHRI